MNVLSAVCEYKCGIVWISQSCGSCHKYRWHSLFAPRSAIRAPLSQSHAKDTFGIFSLDPAWTRVNATWAREQAKPPPRLQYLFKAHHRKTSAEVQYTTLYNALLGVPIISHENNSGLTVLQNALHKTPHAFSPSYESPYIAKPSGAGQGHLI